MTECVSSNVSWEESHIIAKQGDSISYPKAKPRLEKKKKTPVNKQRPAIPLLYVSNPRMGSSSLYGSCHSQNTMIWNQKHSQVMDGMWTHQYGVLKTIAHECKSQPGTLSPLSWHYSKITPETCLHAVMRF